MTSDRKDRKAIQTGRRDRSAAIQEQRPLAPWERPGYFRLDCKPHRGELLRWLGFCSLLAGICFLLPGAVIAVAFRGSSRLAFLILGGSAVVQVLVGCVYLVAREDLREMTAGRTDPAGEDLTRRGGSSAAITFVLAALCALLTLAAMPW